MRDYIVLFRSFNADLPNHWEWFPDGGAEENVSGPSGVNSPIKTYVRIPNQTLLLECLNRIRLPLNTDYYSENGNHFGVDEMWSRLFGGDIVAGYSSLSKMPTSDAYGALHGRPARDSRGRFIGSF